LEVPFNIYAMVEVSDFRFGTQLGFTSPIIKSHTRNKWAWPRARETSKYLGSPFNIYATAEASDLQIGRRLGFAKAHQKSHTEEEMGVVLGLVSSLKFCDFPLFFCNG